MAAAFCATAVHAQTAVLDALTVADSARVLIESAATAGDALAAARARAFVERALARWPDDAWLHHYRGYALYREASIQQGQGGGDTDAMLVAAVEALEWSLEGRDLPESHALLSSVLGQRIALNPLRGITLGARSGEETERAAELGPTNPRVWLLRGIGAFFQPRAFGGGVDRAEGYLRRALELYPGDAPPKPAPAWGHGEAWLWLGRVHEQGGKNVEARDAYRRALELEPGNRWVKDVLLPGVERKIRGG